MVNIEDTLKKIIDNMGELTTLDIRTVVGKVDFDDKGNYILPDKNTEAKVIITRIDLIGGDITTAFSKEFLEPPYDKIREYHALKEQQGHDIIKANIETLKEIIKLIKDEMPTVKP